MSDIISRLPFFEVNNAAATAGDLPQMSWGVTYLGVDKLHATTRGEGVIGVVLDTGIDNSHHDLVNNVIGVESFVPREDATDGQGHGCVLPGTNIYSSMCGLQAIEEVFNRAPGIAHFMPDGATVKDVRRFGIHTLSLDESGRMIRRRIDAIHKLSHSGKLIDIKTNEGVIGLTPWHPVYVQTSQRGGGDGSRTIVKKRADQIVAGDRIALSGRGQGVTDSELKIPFPLRWKCCHCGRIARASKRVQCRGCLKHKWAEPLQEYISLDEKLSFFAGLVASDGHLMLSQKSIEFCGKDTRIVDVFRNLCQELFGKTPTMMKSRGTYRARLHHDRAWSVLQSIGIKAGSKSLDIEFPESICKSPEAVIFSFIAGLIEGDGCISGGKCRVITGSRLFANRLCGILRTLGVRSSVGEVFSTHGFDNGGRITLQVKIGKCRGIADRLMVKKWDVDSENPRYSIKVDSVSNRSYDGPLYDLTVDQSHNYVADGFILSNTHCAGVIAANGHMEGIAPDCKLIGLKVLDSRGSGRNSWIIKALKHIASGAVGPVDFVSLSLGSPQHDPALLESLMQLGDQGIVSLVAAGNEGRPDSVDYPGMYSLFSAAIIAVGSINKRGLISDFSSRGPAVSICAPGEDIVSTIPNDRYVSMSGTSMATPCAAGCLALIMSAWKKRSRLAKLDMPAIINARDALIRTAIDVDRGGFDPNSGWGLVNPTEAMNYQKPVIPQPINPPSSTKPGLIDLPLFGPVKMRSPAQAGDQIGFYW